MPQVKSKFKHTAVEKEFTIEDAYSDIKQKFYTSGDTNFCSASAKYFCAHGGGGGGPLMVMKLGMPGRKDRSKQHIVSYHGNKVSCSGWSPHNDNLLCSGDANGDAYVTFFDDSMFDEDGLLLEDCHEATQTVNTGFKKAVTGLAWHPSVRNLVAICSKTCEIKFFDAASGAQCLKGLEIKTDAPPLSLSWSWDGDYLACTLKSGANHDLKVYRVRNRGDDATVLEGSEAFSVSLGMKASQCVMMNHDDFNYVAAIGVEASSGKRLFKVWDYKLGTGSEPVCDPFSIPEKGTQAIMPFWDGARSMMWYYGKGDLSVSFALWRPKKKCFFPMGLHRSADPIRGGCFVPQRAMNVMDCEIQVFCALRDKGGANIAPFSFTVPRRQKTAFAPELFPDCLSKKPVCGITEYEEGFEILKPHHVTMDPDVEVNDDGDAVFVKKLTYAELEDLYNDLKALVASQKEHFDNADLVKFGLGEE